MRHTRPSFRIPSTTAASVLAAGVSLSTQSDVDAGAVPASARRAHRRERARTASRRSPASRSSASSRPQGRLLRRDDLRQPGPPGGVEGIEIPRRLSTPTATASSSREGRRQHAGEELPGPLVRRPTLYGACAPAVAAGAARSRPRSRASIGWTTPTATASPMASTLIAAFKDGIQEHGVARDQART